MTTIIECVLLSLIQPLSDTFFSKMHRSSYMGVPILLKHPVYTKLDLNETVIFLRCKAFYSVADSFDDFSPSFSSRFLPPRRRAVESIKASQSRSYNYYVRLPVARICLLSADNLSISSFEYLHYTHFNVRLN